MMTTMKVGPLTVDEGALAAVCEKWGIAELAAFGSIWREDFGPESDVDLLVSFSDPRRWRFRDLQQMEREFAALFGRDVDLVEMDAVRENPNPYTRRNILSSAVVLNVA